MRKISIAMSKAWLVKGLLLCGIFVHADVEQSLRVLQQNLKTLSNSIRRPPSEIIKEFYNSKCWKMLKGKAKKTSFSYYFKTEKDAPSRDSHIYQLEKDVPLLGLIRGDIFYIDMGHGDQLEVFDAEFKSKTVLNFSGKVDEKAVEVIKKYPRSLYGKPYNPTKKKQSSSYDPFHAIDTISPDMWEGTALKYRSNYTSEVFSLNITKNKEILFKKGCKIPARTLFYTKDKKVYRVDLGVKDRELIEATVNECEPPYDWTAHGY